MPDLTPFTHKFRASGDIGCSNGVIKVHRRNRQPLSCVPCRAKKLKCDRSHPCETCTKRGDEVLCTYGIGSGIVKAKDAPSDSGRKTQAQERLRTLEGLVMQMMKTNQSEATPTNESLSSPETTTDTITSLSNDGHLRVEGGEAKYTGSTHWSAILDNINDLKSVIATENLDLDNEEEADREAADPDVLFGQVSSGQTLQRILQTYLPSRPQIDRRLAVYFNARYLVVPVLHSRVFQRQYEEFWRDPTTASPLWVSILFSIMCLSVSIGQATEQEPTGLESVSNRRDLYLTAAAQCLIVGGWSRPRKNIVEALLLFTQCKYMRSLDPSREVSMLFCIICRLAFRMGYHRDPDHFSCFTSYEGEMRRRTWAMCKQFELMTAFQLGLPSNIPIDCYDTKEPRNLIDSDFDEDSISLPPSRPETEATQVLYLIVKGRLMSIFSRVCHHALTFRSTSDHEIILLDRELTKEYANIPEPLRLRPMSQSFTDPSYLIMTRTNCDFLFNKSICVLHRKRMAQGNPESRQRCVEAASRILSHLIDLNEELQPGGQLHHDRWMISSFTMSDFLLAAMVLALIVSMSRRETRKHNHSPEDTESSKHINLLEQAFTICRAWGQNSSEAKRVADALGTMLLKLQPNRNSFPAVDLANSRTRPQVPPDIPFCLDEPIHTVANSQPNLSMGDNEHPLPGPHGMLDQFDNIFSGSIALDWTAFDQYMLAPSDFADMGEGWTSTPYSFLGQPQGSARSRWYEVNGVNPLDGLNGIDRTSGMSF